MDYEKVLSKLHALAILLVIGHKDVLHLLGQVVIAAMQGVVEAFGYFKKIVAARDHVPSSGNFQLRQQRNQSVQHLGHSAAQRRGVNHLDGLAAEMARQKTDFVQFRLANDGLIIPNSRSRRWRWLFSVDARVFAPLYKVGWQVRLAESALYHSWPCRRN